MLNKQKINKRTAIQLLEKLLDLGMSKPALRLLSRAGIAGLGASLAIQGIGLLDD